jgi:MYXO-CTERM domain-containing protein
LGAGLLLTANASPAATVRTDHPRLLFGNGTGFGTTVAQFTRRCTGSDADYAHRCQYMGGGQKNAAFTPSSVGDTPGMAAAYLLWGGDQRCSNAATWLLANLPTNGPGAGGDAHSFISSYAPSLSNLAIVRDWCDASLSSTLAGQLETRIDAWTTWFMANYGGNGPVAESPDVFHDDYANVVNAVGWGALILAGTSFDTDAQTAMTWADTRFKQVLVPAHVYVNDWWPEGFTYIQASIGGLAQYAAAWSTATDENIYTYLKTSGSDLFTSYINFFIYAQRPDTNLVYFGDSTSTKQSDQLFLYPLVATLNYGLASPLAQGFMQAITAATTQQAGFCYDVPCGDGWKVALMYDSSLDGTARAASTLPTARWLSQGANDIAILRSGWGPDDTFVWMSCGDYFGAHQHDEAGSFQIFRHGMLTGPTGDYDDFDSVHFDDYYSQHSVHANTVAVEMPNESFPTAQTIDNGATANVNDGGQRPLRRTDTNGVIGSYYAPNITSYLANKTGGALYETGNLTAFEHATCHDYVACDVTAAYQSPGFTTDGNAAKVKEVSRQLVFVRPEVVFLFDRVESTDASYTKRVLFHASGTGVMPAVSSNGFTIDNNGGRLIAKSLLPAGATLNVVQSFDIGGTSYPPILGDLPANEPEMGGNRVEVVPAAPALRDYFLHVFDATDPTKSTLDATVQDGTDTATATVIDGTNTYVVTFNKTGALGGHITVTGTVNCNQDLGANSTTDGGSGATGSDAGGSGAGGGETGSGVAGASGAGGREAAGSNSGTTGAAGETTTTPAKTSKKGGCGCEVAGSPSDLPAAPLLLALLAMGSRWRRSRKPPA